jgi:signal transduction histidine kinase
MTDTPRILIVDDDVALLQALPQALYLRMVGVEVDTSDSAVAAIELLEKHDYDAVVSDIKMPGMDGLALLAKVQELHPYTPTLLITGHGEHGLAVQALRGGAYDFIQKPIDRDYFVAALRRAIQTHQLQRQVQEQQLALQLHAHSLEHLVQRRTTELVAANESKDKFLSIVSHELKNPLTSLKGMVQLLQRQIEKPNNVEVVKRGLESIERSITRVDVLVNDLLDTSLIETNMFVLHRKRCDLVELCRDFLSEYTAGAGPNLTFDYLGKPIEVEVDSNRICQVLMNLLTNARKYSSKGSPITVTLQQAGYEALLSVRDMGIGIPEKAIPFIFDQFYRAPNAEVQNGSAAGLGLGLYVTRKIVERHGGRVEVQSEADVGSVFCIILPLYVNPEVERTDVNSLAPHTQAVWTVLQTSRGK